MSKEIKKGLSVTLSKILRPYVVLEGVKGKIGNTNDLMDYVNKDNHSFSLRTIQDDLRFLKDIGCKITYNRKLRTFEIKNKDFDYFEGLKKLYLKK